MSSLLVEITSSGNKQVFLKEVLLNECVSESGETMIGSLDGKVSITSKAEHIEGDNPGGEELAELEMFCRGILEVEL